MAETTRTIILCVDDHPSNLKLLEVMLRPLKAEILTATSGPAALASVEANPPDVILLDIQMPGMDGLEVCRRLKANATTAEISVIFLTAHGLERRGEALAIGGDDFLTKPLEVFELRTRVQSALQRKKLADEMRSLKQTLAAARSLDDSVLNNLSVGLLVLNPDFQIALANQPAAAILGLPTTSLVELTLAALLDQLAPRLIDVDDVRAACQAALARPGDEPRLTWAWRESRPRTSELRFFSVATETDPRIGVILRDLPAGPG